MFSFFVTHYWAGIALAFVAGAIMGSFLNVCIYRIPLQKSLIWPGSRCGHCLQPIRWRDNVPLLSYWLLRGKCRRCGARFSSRYFWIELFTASSFALLYWLEVIKNIRGVETGAAFVLPGRPERLQAIWLYHVIFFSFLLVAALIDAEYMEIPLRVTIPGTVIGIAGGMLAPWPWPATWRYSTADMAQMNFGGLGVIDVLPPGFQSWPVWMPVPDWLPPGGWQMGLAVGLTGAAVGAFIMWLIRFVFTWAMGREAMGIGDADLMMMIGAFLGWQDVFLVLGLGVFLGLFHVLLMILRNRWGELPFGPFLAGGAVLAMLFPHWPFIGLHGFTQPLFFDAGLGIVILVVFGVLTFFIIMLIRILRLIAWVFEQPRSTS